MSQSCTLLERDLTTDTQTEEEDDLGDLQARLERPHYHHWFKDLWSRGAHEYDFYDLARAVNPDLRFETFDRNWLYQKVLQENVEHAKAEFMSILAS